MIYDPGIGGKDTFRIQRALDTTESISGNNAEVLGGIFTLLKILGSHSITDKELRAIFLKLLRGKRDGKAVRSFFLVFCSVLKIEMTLNVTEKTRSNDLFLQRISIHQGV